VKLPEDSLFTLSASGSPAREWEPRHKLLSLPLLGGAIASAPPELLWLPLTLLGVGFLLARVSLWRSLTAARWFVFLILLLTITRGTRIDALLPPEVTLSGTGAAAGALVGLRIFAVALTGHLYTSITPRGDTVRSLEWLLRPLLGRRRSADLALVVGLSLSTVPVVFRSVYEAGVALTARGLPRRRRVRRMTLVSGVSIQQLLRRSDAMANALVARGYTGFNRSLVFATATRRFSVSLPALGVFLAVLLLGR
jgi:energy-coupling factor transporter transmembrane protein EcfT